MTEKLVPCLLNKSGKDTCAILSELIDHLLMAGFGYFWIFLFASPCEKNLYNTVKLEKINFPFFIVDYYILSWNLRILYLIYS